MNETTSRHEEPKIPVRLLGCNPETKEEYQFQAKWNGHERECKHCAVPIGWAKSKRGKTIPFDLAETDDGIHKVHYITCEARK